MVLNEAVSMSNYNENDEQIEGKAAYLIERDASGEIVSPENTAVNNLLLTDSTISIIPYHTLYGNTFLDSLYTKTQCLGFIYFFTNPLHCIVH